MDRSKRIRTDVKDYCRNCSQRYGVTPEGVKVCNTGCDGPAK